MRTFVALALIGLLVSCPAVCGVGEAGHGPHGHQAPRGAHDERQAPVHCPEDGEDCICNGAVLSSGVRLNDSDTIGLPLLLACIVPTSPHLLAHDLTREGAPIGRADRGDARSVRALLQNFRC